MAEFEDLSETQAFVESAFKFLGYTWEHPRVQVYLKRVSAATGQPCQSRHQLDSHYYRLLASKLLGLIEQEKAKIGQLSIEGAIALQMANKLAINGADLPPVFANLFEGVGVTADPA